MSALVDRIVADDFLWDAVFRAVSLRPTRTDGQFIAFDCPACHLRGEGQDRRKRCGLTKNPDGFGIHCFNCGLRTRWRKGDLLSKTLKDFLETLGMGSDEIARLNHRALQYRSVMSRSEEAARLVRETLDPTFKPVALPVGAKTIAKLAEEGCSNPDFTAVAEYLVSRGEDLIAAYPFYWSPSKHRQIHRRLIIPFFDAEGHVVGWTGRAVDETANKYWTESQPDYLFNYRAMTAPRRQFVILVEGVLDAIAVDGVGLLGAKLNARQIAWIKGFGKRVILVPDRDQRGAQMIDLALSNGWSVSFPTFSRTSAFPNFWDPTIKDCAAAVREYGRLWTLHSILQSATSSNIEISVKRKLFI